MGISGELYNVLENYLSGRFESVILNGQTSSWRPAAASHGSTLDPLLFLIYINDLTNELKPNVKLFVDDASLFIVVKDKNESANVLNNDLNSQSLHGLVIGKCFLIQILVNRLKKCYFQEKKTQVHPTISLNNVQVERVFYQKHLVILFDEKLSFKQHIDSAISKVNKGISVTKNLDIVYQEPFLRPLIDYNDIIYDQPQNQYFCEKIEYVQCKATQGTSRDKIYQ